MPTMGQQDQTCRTSWPINIQIDSNQLLSTLQRRCWKWRIRTHGAGSKSSMPSKRRKDVVHRGGKNLHNNGRGIEEVRLNVNRSYALLYSIQPLSISAAVKISSSGSPKSSSDPSSSPSSPSLSAISSALRFVAVAVSRMDSCVSAEGDTASLTSRSPS